ncbi:type II secretion system F family protein [bacterium]|nr:type II secretion system F family protein [bacterium]
MTQYTYKARDKEGNYAEGSIDASSREQVVDLLRKYELLPTVINEKAEKGQIFSLSSLRKVALKSKVVFSRQLATMIDSGLSIVQSLKILSEQERKKNKKFSEIIDAIAAEIEGGTSFSAALKKHPKVFSPIYVSLVESGEISGKLDEVLDRLATQLEKDYDLRKKVKGAMMYPTFIIIAMVFAAGIVVTFVIPQLKTLFEESKSELPVITKILLKISDFMVSYWWVVILGLIGAVAGVRYFLKSKFGRTFWDGFKIKIPVLGSFLKNIYMVRFTRTLSTLISSGLPILDSLKIVSDTVGNVIYKEEIESVARKVESGVALATPLEESKLFPTMVSHMIEVGEKTGNIDKMLARLASFFDNEVDNTVAALSTLLEPIILLVIALGVGVFVGAVLLPIYQLASAM